MAPRVSPLPVLDPEVQPDIAPDDAAHTAPARGWLIIVHNDDHHTFNYVIDVLVGVLALSRLEALEKSLEVHFKGCAIVAGPMSRYEADGLVAKMRSFGPDHYMPKEAKAKGLSTDPLRVSVEPAA
jgi:ATP-dependent Clp protease adapter protein ClpS